MQVYGKHFYGNEISEYGQKHGRVDYATLAKAFGHVLNNEIMSKTSDIGYWEPHFEIADDEYPEVFQWFIVSDSGAEILEEIGEVLYYNEELDMWLWGVTHYGTSWDYVLTDIPCNTGEV